MVKTKEIFSDYETGIIEGIEEEEVDEEDDDDKEPLKRGRGRPPKTPPTPTLTLPGMVTATKNTMHSLLASMGYPSQYILHNNTVYTITLNQYHKYL